MDQRQSQIIPHLAVDVILMLENVTPEKNEQW